MTELRLGIGFGALGGVIGLVTDITWLEQVVATLFLAASVCCLYSWVKQDWRL